MVALVLLLFIAISPVPPQLITARLDESSHWDRFDWTVIGVPVHRCIGLHSINWFVTQSERNAPFTTLNAAKVR